MPPQRTKASMLVRMFDDDSNETKGKAIRQRMIGKVFVRRDAEGKKIAEHRLSEDKGKPDKKPPRDPRPNLRLSTPREEEEQRAANLARMKREYGT